MIKVICQRLDQAHILQHNLNQCSKDNISDDKCQKSIRYIMWLGIDLHFFTSDAEEYIGCDPNPNTFKQYLKQVETYNSFLPKPKKVTLYNC